MSRLSYVLHASLVLALAAPSCASGGGPTFDGGMSRVDGSVGTDSAAPVDGGIDSGVDGGPPPPCSAGCSSLDTDCSVGVCDMATDLCRADPRMDGTTCNDGSLSSIAEDI